MNFGYWNGLKEFFNQKTYKEILAERGVLMTLLLYFLLIVLTVIFVLPMFFVYLFCKMIYILKTIFIKERKTEVYEKNQ